RTFGHSRAETVGKLPHELGLIAEGEGVEEWIKSLEMGASGLEDDSIVFRRCTDERIHCLYSWSNLTIDQQDCVLVIGQDVTRRVRAEEELRRNREVLLNQERLKAVGELASGI